MKDRIVTKVLYSLEKLYSRKITIFHFLSITNDVTAGTSIPTYSQHTVKTIVLPITLVRKHLYNAAFLATGRNFVYGALYDEFAVPLIFKKFGIDISNQDYCTIDSIRFDFKSVGETADNKSYHVLAQQSPMNTVST